MVQIPVPPATLAALIGIIELVVLEIFRIALLLAQAALRKRTLVKKGSLHLPTCAHRRQRLENVIRLLSLLVVCFIVSLGLTINGITVRQSSSLSDGLCARTRRDTRYVNNYGAVDGDVADRRLDGYIKRSGCKGKLFQDAVAGSRGIEIGYPQCVGEFDEERPRFVDAELVGCGIGWVVNSPAGDYHCDVLPVGVKNETTLAGTSFLAVLQGEDFSRNYWQFEEPSQRMVSNARIPLAWFVNKTDSAVNIDCENDSPLDCYKTVKPKVKDISPTEVQKTGVQGGLYIQVLQNGNSSLCIFSDMSSSTQWVWINQNIPSDVERGGRNGPVMTRFSIRGNAQCVQLEVSTARLYLDAVEKFSLWPGNDTDHVYLLQKLAVATGLKTRSDAQRPCKIYKAVEGSDANKALLILVSIMTALVVFVSCLALVFAGYVWIVCPMKTDPLTPVWSIKELLRTRERTSRTYKDGDVYVGLVEENGVATFDVFENERFDSAPLSKLPFDERLRSPKK